MAPRLFLALLAALAMTSCRNPPARPSPGPGNGQPQQVIGNERLGWDQPGSRAELAEIQFAVYVDGVRSPMSETSCGTTASPNGFPCSGRLPPMSPGTHTLQLAAFMMEGSQVLESSRSAPLQVVVSGGTAVARGAGADRPAPLPDPVVEQPGGLREESVVTAGDGTRLRLELLAGGELQEPVGAAVSPDGTLLVAERPGRVLLVRDGVVARQPALTIDEAAQAGGELLAIALDPRFDDTGFLYAVYTASSRTGAPVYRIARFRQSNGVFGEQAVILDGVAAGSVRPTASLGFGPDGKLYAAFDAGGDPAAAEDLASFNGKVLRLNADGTTPGDQPAGSPVHAYPLGSPRGMAWHRDTGVLWVVEQGDEGEATLTAVVDARPARAKVRQVLALPRGMAAVALYESDRMPALRGSLLIAGGRNRGIWRVRLDPRDPSRIGGAERFMESANGVEVVAVTPDGTIYFSTARRLARLVPVSR